MPTVRKKIRIGNQTSFSAASVAAPFRYAVNNGFDAFEWFPDKKASGQGWTIHDIGIKSRHRIKNIARDHGIAVSFHTLILHTLPNQQTQKEVLRHVDVAEELGASLFNIHLHAQNGIDAFIHENLPLIERLAEKKMKLSIENTPQTGPEVFNALFDRLQATRSVDSAHVGMCLDLGHANLCPETRNDYLKFVDLLDTGIPVIHLHLHENYGDYDSHIPLFQGPAGSDDSGIKGLVSRLIQRGFSGTCILEQWPAPPSLLNDARDRLLEMWSDMEIKLRA